MARKPISRSKAPGRPGNASEWVQEILELRIRFESLRANKTGISPWSLHVLNFKTGEGFFLLPNQEAGQDMMRFRTWAEANEILDTAEVFVQ